jgi:membrane-bound metal-dependent hydrolase YbcI (DUF457 family)
MIFFGHVGLTTGIIKGAEAVASKGRAVEKLPVDYRLVMLGAMLPDIIDKPVGLLFRNTFPNSRLFAHTLLFSILLLSVVLWRYRRKQKNTILLLGVSSFIHIILDGMWNITQNLFWPLYSWSFPPRTGDWISESLEHFLHDPFLISSELIGFAILSFFFIRSIRRKEFKSFIRAGKL